MSQAGPADVHWGEEPPFPPGALAESPPGGPPDDRRAAGRPFRAQDGDRGGWPEGGGFERVPPQDIDAEQSVLGGMLLSKDAIADVVEVLKGADFYRPAHETIFVAILDLYARGEPADPITVAAELTKRGELSRVGGSPYLHTLVNTVPTAANAEFYAEIVHERAVLRRLVEAGTRITQMGYAADGDVDEIVNRAQAEIYAVTEQRTSEDYLPLGEIMEGALDEIEAIGSRSGEMSGVPTGFADLDALTNGLHPGQMIVVAARPAMGKALALDTPLPTPAGWTTMGEVGAGDLLLAADGTPTRVVAATGVMAGRPCYEITFDDGTTVVADADHQWLTETWLTQRSPTETGLTETGLTETGLSETRPAGAGAVRRPAREPGRGGPGGCPSVRTTKEIAAEVGCVDLAGRRLAHSVPNAAPLRLPHRELPVPPYTLGAWLGAGHSRAALITSADRQLVRRVAAEGIEVRGVGTSSAYALRFAAPQPEPAKPAKPADSTKPADATNPAASAEPVSPVEPPEGACEACPTSHSAAVPEPCGAAPAGNRRSLLAALRGLDVLGRKHIPRDYLRGCVAQRRALLAGLLDTHGTVTGSGAVRFTATDRAMAEGFRELVTSLGYRCAMSAGRSGRLRAGSSAAYVITFTTSDDVFGLERKRRRHTRLRRPGTPGTVRRFVTGVRQIDSVPVRCVQVDHPDHLYLATRSMVPTHNSTLALDFARACSVANGMPSVIFSLEMGRNEIAMRLLSAEARVALHHMRSGSMTDDDWTRLARRMPDVSNAPLYIDDSPNLSMMEIRAKCRRLKQRNDLRMVVIDYLQLMQSGGSRRPESRQQEVSDMSRNLKLLAKELEVPVIALSQLNRGPEQRTDKRPMVSDLRESGSIEQDADVVILLHREDAYEKESPRAGEADLIVAKHRNGPTATITVAFQGHYSRFVDMAQT